MLATASLLSSLLLLPPAAPARAPEPHPWSRDAYLLVDPMGVSVALRSLSSSPVQYQWGASAGRLWGSPRAFAVALGFNFEHRLSFEPRVNSGSTFSRGMHTLRAQVELRPGVRVGDERALFLHGNFAFGYAHTLVALNFEEPGRRNAYFNGVGFGLGAGLALDYRFDDGLMVGVEAEADLGWGGVQGGDLVEGVLIDVQLGLTLGWSF